MPNTPKSKDDVKILIEQAEQGIENYFQDANSMKEYLDFKSKFHQYSLLNNILIQQQFPGAEAVGSFTFFKERGFSVKRGEKGIKIRAMCNYQYFENESGETKLVSRASPAEKIKIKSGDLQTFKGKSFCKLETVFDISQTTATADDLPKLFPNRWLEGSVKDYQLLYKGALVIAEKQHTKILDAPKSELGASKGCCYPKANAIALNPRNSELQNIKTLFHELAHAKLHIGEKLKQYAPYQMELQAEMTAYVVCKHYGIDTSEYSFKYMHNWIEGKSLEDKKQLLNEVSDTAKSFIKTIDEVIEKELENTVSIEKDTQISEHQLSHTERNPEANQPKNIRNMLHEANIESSPRLIKNIQKLNQQSGKFLNVKEIQQMQKSSPLSQQPDMEKLINSICKDMQQLEMVMQR